MAFGKTAKAKDNRYFRIFVMGQKLDKKLKGAGFTVNSWKEGQSYAYIDGELREDPHILSPQGYMCDGSIWNSIEFPYERYLCLMRQPELGFEQLWILYLTTDYEDDEIGSLCLLISKHNSRLLTALSDLLYSTTQTRVNGQFKKKLTRIEKRLDIIGYDYDVSGIREVLASLQKCK